MWDIFKMSTTPSESDSSLTPTSSRCLCVGVRAAVFILFFVLFRFVFYRQAGGQESIFR